jgi:hypothetical protein
MFERFFDRLRRGWRMGRTALGVLASEKKLLIFPLLSCIALLMVLASFLLPLLLNQDFLDMLNNQNGGNVNQAAHNVLYYVLLFAFYVCSYSVIVFFNSALVACALIKFNGEEPTLDDGFRAAFSRLPQILMWALVSATVGVALKFIQNRSGKLGQIVAGLLGTAWGIMTYFVVPVLVVEKLGPFDAIKRSWSIMKRTWGEGLAANFGVGLVIFALTLLSLIPFFLGMMIGGWAVLIGLLVTMALIALLSLVSSAANSILTAALYLYAAQDRVPEGFKEATLRRAFAKG